MISTRGPNNILVLDRSTVPVVEICSEIIAKNNIKEITTRYPVSSAEVFACAELYSDHYGPTEYDFIELESIKNDAQLDIVTVGISDWVFLSLINFAHFIDDQLDDIRTLYSIGLERVLFECLLDIKDGVDDFRHSNLHNMVFDAFEIVYGKIDQDNVNYIIEMIDAED